MSRASLILPSHRGVLGCGIDQYFVRSALLSLLLVFVKETLNPNSGIFVSKCVESGCVAYVGWEYHKICGMQQEKWTASKGFPQTKALPLHILHFL